jgi:hypothetical protein
LARRQWRPRATASGLGERLTATTGGQLSAHASMRL